MADSQRPQSFAERHGPTALLIAGMLLVLAAIGAVFTGHEAIGGGLAVPGLVAIGAAAVLSRLEDEFEAPGGFKGKLRPLEPPLGEVEAAEINAEPAQPELPRSPEWPELPSPDEAPQIATET